MPNPVFNEETMKRDAAGWAAPACGGACGPGASVRDVPLDR